MRFWDSSAVVPLLVAERSTEATRRLQDDPGIAVWRFTPLEVMSALERRRREGALDEAGLSSAMEGLAILERSWSPIMDAAPVERRARRLLAVHALRAADALQLAAALVTCDDRPELLPLVTLDTRLAEAARKEGFQVLPRISG